MNASNREKSWDVYPVVPEGRWAFYFKSVLRFTLIFPSEADAMALLSLLNTCGAVPAKTETEKKKP